MTNCRGGVAVGPVRQGGGVVPPASPPILLDLPVPPSVNEMFKNVRGVGRVNSKVYSDWLGHAGWVLKGQRPGRISGPVVINIAVERRSLAADIDNRLKALLDLLVHHKVIDDDRFVVGLMVAWAPKANGLAHVLIMPAQHLTCEFHLAADRAHGGWFISGIGDTPDGDFVEQSEADDG